MPFTFSHPAIILPLNFLPKKYISLTGLVVGSMTPDFEYFLRMKVQSDYSHTLTGLLWFDWPLGILITFVFHNIVRNPLFSSLPKELRLRLSEFKKFNWNEHFKKYWIVIIYSVLIGAASHLLWDSFTHFNGYVVDLFHPLSSSISILNISIPVYKIIQHASTVIGGIIIFIVLYRLPKSNQDKSINSYYWMLVLSILSITLVIRFISGINYTEYGNIIVSCISALFLALIGASLIMRYFKFSNTYL